MYKKAERGTILFLCLTVIELGCWSSPAFRLGLETYPRLSWASSLPTVGLVLLSLHHCVGQVLIISEEPRLISYRITSHPIPLKDASTIHPVDVTMNKSV